MYTRGPGLAPLALASVCVSPRSVGTDNEWDQGNPLHWWVGAPTGAQCFACGPGADTESSDTGVVVRA
jgi:hypothetical protein